MAEQTAEQDPKVGQPEGAPKRTRERSTIEFPYGYLDIAYSLCLLWCEPERRGWRG